VGENISSGLGLVVLGISILLASIIISPENPTPSSIGRYELNNGVIFDTVTGNSWDCVGIGNQKCQLIVEFTPPKDN